MKTVKLKGIPASLGECRGKVVYVKAFDDIKKVNVGDIIVTNKITTEYTEAFMRSAGVISSKGGVTCHAAILCREFKKPCITACAEVFSVVAEHTEVVLEAQQLEVTFLV